MLWLVWAAPLSVQVLTFWHPRLVKGVFFTFGLIVFQPLLGAVLLHSLSCNTHCHSDTVSCLLTSLFFHILYVVTRYLMFSYSFKWLSFSLSFVLFVYILYVQTHIHTRFVLFLCAVLLHSIRTDTRTHTICAVPLCWSFVLFLCTVPLCCSFKISTYKHTYMCIYTHDQLRTCFQNQIG